MATRPRIFKESGMKRILALRVGAFRGMPRAGRVDERVDLLQRLRAAGL